MLLSRGLDKYQEYLKIFPAISSDPLEVPSNSNPYMDWGIKKF